MWKSDLVLRKMAYLSEVRAGIRIALANGRRLALKMRHAQFGHGRGTDGNQLVGCYVSSCAGAAVHACRLPPSLHCCSQGDGGNAVGLLLRAPWQIHAFL